jgi:hypothetical protein
MSDAPLRLEVLSAASEPGGSAPNEDRYGYDLEHGYAWVLDGATSTAPPRISPGQTDGAWFADQVDNTLRSLAASGDSLSPVQMLELAAAQARASLEERGLDPDERPPYASIALVALQGQELHYAVLGDVALMVAPPDEEAVEIRDHRSDPFVKEAIDLTYRYTGEELLAEQHAFEARAVNTSGGYPVLSASPAAAKLALSGVMPAQPGLKLLLTSDGLTRLVDVFRQPAILAQLLDRIAGDPEGNDQAIKLVRETEARDGDRRRHRRIKVHDDATGICLEVRTPPAVDH